MTLPLLAAAAQAAQAAADGTLSLAWLTVALPLAGFLANGLIALRWPRAKAAVSVIGPAVLIGAFAVALALFLRVRAIGLEEPFIQRLWTWIPSGSLVVDFAFQVDQLSLVMLLVVTGVGSLIHLFSVGYMRADDGYARYFAYLNLFVVFMLVLCSGPATRCCSSGGKGWGSAPTS